MPRTKRTNKKQEKITVEDNAYFKKLDEAALYLKKKIDENVEKDIHNLEIAFKVFMKTLDKELMTKTIGELKNEPFKSEEHIKKKYKSALSTPSACDDGYATENSSTHDSGDRNMKKRGFELLAPPAPHTLRRSRSADARTTKSSLASATGARHRRRSRSAYKTPSCSKMVNYPPITPKVAPETPVALLRQPRQGEMAVSMSGSPLMMPAFFSMQPDEKANCNILLEDGTTLSLQAKARLRESQQAYIPYSLMNPSVMDQLKILKENLDMVVKLGQKEK